MESFRLQNSTLLIRAAVDEIVYVKADGNYSDIVLINGRSYKITYQLNQFEKGFNALQNSDLFIRVGRSLIVNWKYVQIINLVEQTIVFGGKHLVPQQKNENPHSWRPGQGELNAPSKDIYTISGVSRDALRYLKEQLAIKIGGEQNEQ